jgi:hypothetical protein
MSATGRGAERHPGDFYETPAWCVRRYLEARGDRGCGPRWLEPSAGAGAIIRAVNAVRPGIRWTAIEKYRYETGELGGGLVNAGVGPIHYIDFLTASTPLRFDLCIGNPPYSLAREFVEHGLKMAHEVAFLLRLNFLESAKRVDFFKAHPCDVFVLPNRPSFTADGHTDATAYAWFEFGGMNRGRLSVLAATPVAERSQGR